MDYGFWGFAVFRISLGGRHQLSLVSASEHPLSAAGGCWCDLVGLSRLSPVSDLVSGYLRL